MRRIVLLGFCVVLVGVTGCGGNQSAPTTTSGATTTSAAETTTTTAPATTTTAPATTTTAPATTTTAPATTTTQPDLTDEALDEGTAAIEGYLEAFEDDDFRGMGALATGAAAAYADYLLASTQTFHGLPALTVTLTEEPESAELLPDGRYGLGGTAQITEDGEITQELTEFIVTKDEGGQFLVDSWTRDNGYPLEQLIYRGGGDSDSVQAPGVTVTTAFVWHTPAGEPGVFNLCVVVTLDNQRDKVIDVYGLSAAFVSTSSRRQYEVGEAYGPSEVQPGSIADLYLLWGSLDDTAEGGRVILEVVDAETYDSLTVEVPIPPIPGETPGV